MSGGGGRGGGTAAQTAPTGFHGFGPLQHRPEAGRGPVPSEATEHRTGGKRGVCARGWSLIPMAVGSSPASSQVGRLAARCDRTCSDWSAPGPSPCDRDLARRGWDSVKQVHLPNPPGLPGCLPSGAQGCRGPSPPHAPSSRAWGVNTGLCTSTNWHPLKVPSWTQGESCHLSSHPLSSRDAEKVALSSLRVKALLPLDRKSVV